MEEVRSYWQVAGITHFCTLFQRPFKLPQFEPEELEQAFIIDVPVCEKELQNQNNLQLISNGHRNLEGDNLDSLSDKDEEDNKSVTESVDGLERNRVNQIDTYSSSSGYLSSVDTNNRFQPPRNTSSYSSTLNYQNLIDNNFQQNNQQKVDEDQTQQQQDLHLLVKLAIALLKPHFSTKITPNNWENYLRRIVEANWVELEHYPSPFRVPFVSPEGIELTKNLNFNDLPLSDKIDLFYALCDYRFWCDDASDAIKDYPVEELRLESIGKDQQGYEYYYFSGTRLFKEDNELTQDLISRKKRIKELEFELVEHERNRIIKEIEERKRAEIQKAKRLAQEAREARQAIKRQQEEEDACTNSSAPDDKNETATKRRKRNSTLLLPPRTGLRERRSSATSNNHESKQKLSETPTRTTRGSLAKQNNSSESKQHQQSQSAPKSTRGSTRTPKQNEQTSESKNSKGSSLLEQPRKSPEEECREELERLAIKPDERKAAWSIQCESLEDWESFVNKFEKTKSTNERHLYTNLSQYILPNVRAIYAKRAAEARRKEKEMLMSLATRRVSTRIITKKAQEEEEERRAQIREAELQKKKAEAEIRLRAELEREMRARQNRFVINGGAASSTCSEDGEENTGRYNLRQQHDFTDSPSHEFDGIIHPDRLSDFYEALELIIDTTRTSKHAWPFVDPVPKTVPGYYDLIKDPMDLRTLRTKVEFREYKSLIELEKDFQLLVNNCERFNGPKNVYTKMVYKLWKSFRKNVKLYLQRDLHMDEYETFIYPPQRPEPPQIISNEAPPENNSDRKNQTDPQTEIEQFSQNASPLRKVQSPEISAQTEPSAQLVNSTGLLPHEENHLSETLTNATPVLEVRLNEVSQKQVGPEKDMGLPCSLDPSNDPQQKPVAQSKPEAQTKLESHTEPPVTQLATVLDQIGTASDTIVEEIIFDTPDNEVYIWQDTVIQENQ